MCMCMCVNKYEPRQYIQSNSGITNIFVIVRLLALP